MPELAEGSSPVRAKLLNRALRATLIKNCHPEAKPRDLLFWRDIEGAAPGNRVLEPLRKTRPSKA